MTGDGLPWEVYFDRVLIATYFSADASDVVREFLTTVDWNFRRITIL